MWSFIVPAHDEAPLLGAGELDTIVRHVSARTAGLGPLESLLADATITEVMVNASTGVWIERDGERSWLITPERPAAFVRAMGG